MAANILIYGNDIGDTARVDLARAQIMDQRSRDAAAQRQGTAARMQQGRQFGAQLNQQDQQFWANQQMRGQELEEQRNAREAIERADREARLQIAEEQRESALIESARRAFDSGMLSDSDIEGMLPQVGPRAQSYLRGLQESARRQQQQEYDVLQSEADRLNAMRAKEREAFQKGIKKPILPGLPSWIGRTEAEAAEQNAARQRDFDAQAARELGGVDEALRYGLRYDRATGEFAPNLANPSTRRAAPTPPPGDALGVDYGGEMGVGGGDPLAPAPAPAPAPAAAPAPAPAAAAGPDLGQLMAAVGLSPQDIPVVQNIIAQLAPQVGVDQAIAIAIDRVSKEKVRGMQQQMAPPPAMAPPPSRAYNPFSSGGSF